MLQKNERGEQARDYFIAVENKQVEVKLALQRLSPTLQTLINIELRQNKHEAMLLQMESSINEASKKVDNISEIVALTPDNWRKDANRLVSKIALKCGGYNKIDSIWTEVYSLLTVRFGARLDVRLTNKKKTMALHGISRSRIEKANNLDVIEEDKKLIGGLIIIIKELCIRYGVNDIAAS